MPANGETVMITTQSDIPVKVSDQLLKRTLEEYNGKSCVTKSHRYTYTASNVFNKCSLATNSHTKL